MANVRVFQVDAFTSQRFGGNPAGVVLDADALSATDMRLLARELGSADTAFVLAPDGPDHDLRVRFLTPRGEAAFIGHATLAVHAVFSTLGGPVLPRQKQASGIVTVDVLQAGATPRILIHQPPPPLRDTLPAALLAELLEVLGLPAASLDARCPAMLAGASSARVLLAVADGSFLTHMQPDLPRLAALCTRVGAPGVFVFTLRPSVPDVYTEARMFCPALGFAEDPVSGNAHALLGTYLLRHGLLGPRPAAPASQGIIEFTGAQGHHMERAGRVTVALALDESLLTSVSIVGEAVVAFATSMTF